MGSVDLPHFKRLLLEKRGELSSALGEAQSACQQRVAGRVM